MEAEREKLISRVDVLGKTKDLLLLSQLEMATTKQVAEFYGVNIEAIKSIANRNADEIQSDGYIVLKGKEIKEKLEGFNLQPSKISHSRGAINVDSDGFVTKLSHNKNGLFPKRAILRVGMLLKGCYVTYSEVYTGTTC